MILGDYIMKFEFSFDMPADKNFVWERFGKDVKSATDLFLSAIFNEWGEYPINFSVKQLIE